MLWYVLVRQMSQGNFTERQLISCLHKRSHYTDINSKLWSVSGLHLHSVIKT